MRQSWNLRRNWSNLILEWKVRESSFKNKSNEIENKEKDSLKPCQQLKENSEMLKEDWLERKKKKKEKKTN